jgi:RNA polymerase sigma factor (sigma-70 family)
MMNQTDLNAWMAREILVHEKMLRGYLARISKNPADIDDVIQETYARLLALSESSFAAVRNWHSFVLTSARNVMVDRIRRNRVVSLDAMVELGSLDVLDPQPAADDALNARQELALLAEAIAGLPARCREVLTLRKLYGLSQREIAAQLGIAESTVEKHVAYGVRLCADRLFAQRRVPSFREKRSSMLTRKENTDERK